MEYDKAKKKSQSKQAETAQLTATSSNIKDEVDVSYYDEAFSASVNPNRDIFDTGATSHMFSDRSRLTNAVRIPPSRIGVASKNGSIWASVKGLVKISGITLRDVLHSPELTGNLISVGRLCDDGHTAIFRAQEGYILDKSKRVLLRLIRDPSSDQLWHPAVSPKTHEAYSVTTSKTDIALLWHRRLGHLHPDGVIDFLKRRKGMVLARRDFLPCDACAMGKLKFTPAINSLHRATTPLGMIHTDLLGPISPSTVSGMKYILTFIGDHTRFCTVYLLKSKDETLSKFLEYKVMMESKLRTKIGVLKSDRGGEYSSD